MNIAVEAILRRIGETSTLQVHNLVQILICRLACDWVVNENLRHDLLHVKMSTHIMVGSSWSDSAMLILDPDEPILLKNEIPLVRTSHRAIV